MAESSTGNVETRLTQSAGHLAADVHASNSTSALAPSETAASAENIKPTASTNVENNDSSKASDQSGDIKENNSEKTDKVLTEIHDGDGSTPMSESPTKSADTAEKPVARASSVKKPATFKAVSINKKYLEKAAHATPSAPGSKLGFSTDKSAASTTNTTAGLLGPKRRLINKTVSVSQTSAAGSGANGGKPVEQKVWTKNQPPPVIPPKELSDEELKRTYGIHLASRLQSDDNTNEPKWGDEDDDEDWVPEVPTEWAEAMKLPAAAASPEAPATKTATPASETRTPEPEKLVKEPQKLVTVSQTLKPAPPPRASPWAPVPPANVSPIPKAASPVVAPARPYERPGPPHGYSREINADNFDRSSWHDRRMNTQRELYNSRTGELEPVRRGAPPREQAPVNRPAVLQRGTIHNMTGPAEPSPAFQSHRTSHYRDDFRRRRTSSNVSGGSGGFGRRPSFNDNASYTSERPLISPGHPPASFHAEPQAPPSVASTAPPAPPTPVAAPVEPVIDPALKEAVELVAKQPQIMKESALQAKRRRQEQEAAEEAARRERLRIKLLELERIENEKKEKERKEKEEKERQEAEERAKKEAEEEARLEAKKAEEERLAQEAAAKAAAAAAAAAPAVQPYRPPQSQDRQHGAYGSHTSFASQSHWERNAHPPKSPQKPMAVPATGPQQQWKGQGAPQSGYSRWGPSQPPQGPPSNQQHAVPNGVNPWGPVGERPRPAGDAQQTPRYAPPRGPPHMNAGVPPQQEQFERHGQAPPSPLPGHAQPSYPPRGPVGNQPGQQQQWSVAPPSPQPQNRTAVPPYRPHGFQRDVEENTDKSTQPWRRPSADPQPQQQQQTLVEPVSDLDRRTQPGFSGYGGYQTAPAPQTPIPIGPSQNRPPTQSGGRSSRFFPTAPVEPPAQVNSDLKLRRLQSPPSPPPPICPVDPAPGEDTSPVVSLPRVSLPNVADTTAPPTPQPTAAERSPQMHRAALPIHRENPRSPRAHSGIDAFEAVQNKIKAKLEEAHQRPHPSHQPTSPTTRFSKPAPINTSAPLHPQARGPPTGGAITNNEFHITSSTKLPLTATTIHDTTVQPAKVSLPKQKPATFAAAQTSRPSSPTSKPNEEALFNSLYAQTFGSQPMVRIPATVSPMLYKPAPSPPPQQLNQQLGGKQQRGKQVRLRVESVDYYNIAPAREFQDNQGNRFIPVRLPGSYGTPRKEVPFYPTSNSGAQNASSTGGGQGGIRGPGKRGGRKGKGMGGVGEGRSGASTPSGGQQHGGQGGGYHGERDGRQGGNRPVTYVRGGMGMAGISRRVAEVQ